MTKRQLKAMAKSLQETAVAINYKMTSDRRLENPPMHAAMALIAALANAVSAAAEIEE